LQKLQLLLFNTAKAGLHCKLDWVSSSLTRQRLMA